MRHNISSLSKKILSASIIWGELNSFHTNGDQIEIKLAQIGIQHFNMVKSKNHEPCLCLFQRLYLVILMKFP